MTDNRSQSSSAPVFNSGLNRTTTSPRQAPATPKSEPVAAATGATATQCSTIPAHGDIARRAYEIYNDSGCEQGRCQRNWQQAERELRTPSAVVCADKLGTAPVVRTASAASGVSGGESAAHAANPRGGYPQA